MMKVSQIKEFSKYLMRQMNNQVKTRYIHKNVADFKVHPVMRHSVLQRKQTMVKTSAKLKSISDINTLKLQLGTNSIEESEEIDKSDNASDYISISKSSRRNVTPRIGSYQTVPCLAQQYPIEPEQKEMQDDSLQNKSKKTLRMLEMIGSSIKKQEKLKMVSKKPLSPKARKALQWQANV